MIYYPTKGRFIKPILYTSLGFNTFIYKNRGKKIVDYKSRRVDLLNKPILEVVAPNI